MIRVIETAFMRRGKVIGPAYTDDHEYEGMDLDEALEHSAEETMHHGGLCFRDPLDCAVYRYEGIDPGNDEETRWQVFGPGGRNGAWPVMALALAGHGLPKTGAFA